MIAIVVRYCCCSWLGRGCDRSDLRIWLDAAGVNKLGLGPAGRAAAHPTQCKPGPPSSNNPSINSPSSSPKPSIVKSSPPHVLSKRLRVAARIQDGRNYAKTDGALPSFSGFRLTKPLKFTRILTSSSSPRRKRPPGKRSKSAARTRTRSTSSAALAPASRF